MTSRQPKALRWAALAVLPYLVLALVWVFTNPPDAAPDEHDHLVKALGAGQFDVGVPFAGQPYDQSLAAIRNASISRTMTIPIRLDPDGFDCLAFHPERTADCQPQPASSADGTMEATATVGAYPVFGYIPMGMAALRGQTPTQAFLLGRLVSVLMSTVFALLAAWQLLRWLGRGALLGLAIAITPMALFASASLSTSGLEIMSAIAVGSIAVIVTRRPEALADRATLATLAASAAALVLSRQLGVVTLALAAVIALTRGGAPVVWRQLRAGRPAMIVTLVVVGLAGLTILWWERSFDHPAGTASVLSSFSADAWGTFLDLGYGVIRMGIGVFGWVDTPLPGLILTLWIVATVTLIGSAVLLGRRADAWTLMLSLLYVCVVGYVVQATVFTPIQAGIQGRHLLPVFALVPILAGVVLQERLADFDSGQARRRLFGFVAVVVAFVQVFAILVNARRYAVGIEGPIWFLPTAKWAPVFGWLPWLLIAVAAAVGLAWMIIWSGRVEPVPPAVVEDGPVHADVVGTVTVPTADGSDGSSSDAAESLGVTQSG